MAEPRVSFFKKGKTRPASVRRREEGGGEGEEGGASAVVVPVRRGSAAVSKRRRAEDDDDAGVGVRWAAGAASSAGTARGILDADDAAARAAKRARPTHDAADSDAPARADDGQYRGLAAYRRHAAPGAEVPKSMRAGPQRAPAGSTIRTVTVVDYQPDVCKDYKETGFCGFGDTCKFLHDRGTYLAGWQLDALAAAAPAAGAAAHEESSDEEAVPFACLICRKAYTDPVVTRCGHYYCSACAIRRYARTPKCLACGAPTGGIFNRADKVIAKASKQHDSIHDE